MREYIDKFLFYHGSEKTVNDQITAVVLYCILYL